MPKQRWRNEVLDELRGSRQEIRVLGSLLHDEGEANRRALDRLGEQNRAAVRDMKASVDRNTEVTERGKDVLDGLVAEVRRSSNRTDDLMEEIKAQTSALLILVDEIRGQR